MRDVYKSLVGKPEGKKTLGKSRRRWECSSHIIMDLKEIGWEGMDWIQLSQGRDQWRTVLNLHIL
jgi:hypothetical protein